MFPTRPSLLLLTFALVFAIAACGGSSPGELRTSAQAHSFVSDLARGDAVASWHLVGDAGEEAKRAWSERTAIADLGARIRAIHAQWACDLAEGSAAIGFGKFNENDRVAVTSIAEHKGAPIGQVKPLIADVERIANPDLRTASAVLIQVCGS